MTRTQLFIDGNRVGLGERIGKGGEGEVFALASDQNMAVKLYSSPDRHREAKIEAMVKAGLYRASPLVSFPIAAVRERHGRFIGFSMRRVHGHKPLHELYAPGARKASFPAADYRFLIRAASNIAIAVSQVHSAQSVIGDINHSGFLVSDKAMAAIIDADSFQFGNHGCRVGVPEYTPPELQGVRLGGITRSQNHDAFGLAIVVFQLLFMGRHPFVGRSSDGDIPIERAIREGRFVYSRLSNIGGHPPPGAAGLGEFPQSLGSLFEAAFGNDPDCRPDAATWAKALKALESSLSRCRENDLHYFPTAAGSCIWCRMERASGAILFTKPLPNPVPGRDPGSSSFDLSVAWRAIEAVGLPNSVTIAPTLPSLDLAASEEAVRIGKERSERRFTGIALMVGAVALFGWQPSLWLLALPIGWWGYTRIYGSNTDTKSIEKHFSTADNAYDSALANWHHTTGINELHARRKELVRARERYQRLPDEKLKRLQDLTNNRRSNQLRRHLEGFRISRAKVRGVGQGKVASLASYGIETAADIERNRVLSVPGFGPVITQSLIDWRARVENRFRYVASLTAQDQQDELRIIRETDAEAGRLRASLSGGAQELRTAAASVTKRLGRSDPALMKAARDLEQARIDLIAVGLPIPKKTPSSARATVAVNSPSTFGQASRPRGTGTHSSTSIDCPQCGGPMRRRLARRGSNAGRYFMGCNQYPRCTGTRSI